MPRLARVVIPHLPYHVTQRGNRREDVFFCDEDRLFYLSLLKEYSEKYGVEVWAYCLMSNHVHLILKPSSEKGLQQVLKPLHMRYAQYINKKKGWKGHLWQGRFFSSALDQSYAFSAIRYVEQNPVRARLVSHASDYRWSSARGHMGLELNALLCDIPSDYVPASVTGWKEYLNIETPQACIDILRRNVEKGLPCGDDGFVEMLGRKTNRNLHFKPIGRPKKQLV